MSTRLSTAVYADRNSRQLVPAVASRGAVEEEEVDDPRPHRGQHLIDEQKESDARGEECAQRRRVAVCAATVSIDGAYLRKPALRHEQETEEGELCGRGRQEQVLRRPEQGEERDAEEPADQEPDREARHDPRE